MTYITQLTWKESTFGSRIMVMALVVLGIIAMQSRPVHAQWTTNGNNINNTNTGNVGIGTTAPQTIFNVNQTAGGSKGFLISGDEYHQTGNGSSTSGVLLLLGVNRTGNRQLWLGDRDNLGSSTNGFFRIQSAGQFNSMDAVSGNGVTRLPLNLGTDTTNVGVGFNDFTSAPGSKLSVAGNLSVGNGYKAAAAPANGMVIEGNVGIGTSTPNSNYKLDVNGNTNVTGNLNASGTITGGTILANRAFAYRVPGDRFLSL